MKLYICGPRRVLTDAAALDCAAASLRQAGYQVVVPKCLAGDIGASIKGCLRDMLECDGVAVVGLFMQSQASRLEARLAIDVGMTLKSVDQWLLPPPAMAAAALAKAFAA